MLIGVLFLVTVWGYSPLEAGLAMTPGAIVAAAVASLRPTQPRAAVTGGAVILAIAGAICMLALPATPSFITFWLPVGVLIGIGMGAITTGISSAAALSVEPQRFAAAVGLNQTARLLGGALGVAALAALVGTELASFKHVYLFCTIATLGVAVLGRRL